MDLVDSMLVCLAREHAVPVPVDTRIGGEVGEAPHKPHNGGVLSTAGILVFQGNADGELAAYNAVTGKRLWSAPSQTEIIATPVTTTKTQRNYGASWL